MVVTLLFVGVIEALPQPITVTTFVGPQELPGVTDGDGEEARFSHPAGLAVDRGGNLYVADEYIHVIRKVSPAGAVSTLAGLFYTQGRTDGPASQARFVFPQGVATDDAGNVWVADTYNNVIRKITPTGAVSTFAGQGIPGSADGSARTARFSYPTGLTVQSDGSIYVADTRNHTIRKISLGGDVTTLAGSPGAAGAADGIGGAARFYYPNAVASDSAGNVFVVDTWNHAIRKVTPGGSVSTYCGALGARGSTNGDCAVARFAYPNGIAIDRHGDLYVADTFNFCIRKITAEGKVSIVAGRPDTPGSTDGTAAEATFDQPQGIAVDDAGTIYVSELTDATIRTIRDGRVSTLAGMAVSAARANVDGPGTAARFGFPAGIALDPAGNLYVADLHNYTIRKVTPAAEVTTLAGRPGVPGVQDGAATTAAFAAPRGVACDAHGNVYVADSESNTIRKIAPSGTVSTFAGSPDAAAGNVDGQGANARFNFPWGLAADGAGNVYVADSRNHTVRQITPSGLVSTVAGLAGVSGSADGTRAVARFSEPHGVAVDRLGNVYVADTANSTIRKITPEGLVTTIAGAALSPGSDDGAGVAARFDNPAAVAVADDGTLFVADGFNHTIRAIDPSGYVTTVAGTATGGTFFGELEGRGTADGTGKEAQLRSPGGLALDAHGNVFIADSGNATIRLGRPVIPDLPTATLRDDGASDLLLLDTSPQTATSWEWLIMRRPPEARATLSSSTVRAPTFRPDVPGLYVIRLTAAGPSGARITYAYFTSTVEPPTPVRRRSVRH